jgi:hypothetical protein
MSEQTEDFATGVRSIQESQGYTPMSPAPRDIAAAAEENAAVERLVEQMDKEVAEPGQGVNTPFEIQYNRLDSEGRRTDERSPENQTIKIDRAAADVADYRRGLEQAERASRDIELSHEIDKLRSGEAAPKEPVAQQMVEQQPQEPQPEAPTLPPELATPENEELVKAFQREPKLLEAMNTLSWQTDQKVAAASQQALQYAESVQRQYAQELAANAQHAISTVFAAYPELQGLTQEQLPAAIQVISKQDPNRALQLKNHIQSVQLLSAKAQEAQAAQVQHQQQRATAQFQNWAQQQDDAWEQSMKNEPPARQAAIRREAHSMLRSYGLSDQQINHEWNTNPLFRSAAGQKVLAAAAAWSLHQRTTQSIKPAPVPPVRVQQPGPSGQRASEDDVDMRALSNKLNGATGREAVKLGAQMIAARRARSR